MLLHKQTVDVISFTEQKANDNQEEKENGMKSIPYYSYVNTIWIQV